MEEVTYPLKDNLGFIRLDRYCADDLSVVNAARVSFNKRHEKMQEGDDKLVNFLMKNRHGTPFEMNFFRFHVKAPIFVFREWHRHRIGISINEWSARYSELLPEFYIPSYVRTQTGKPGYYTYESLNDNASEQFRTTLGISNQIAFRGYKQAIELGVAKEQARFFLPVNIYSEMYWACNARSMMSFLSLRNNPKAQWEICQYAKAMENMFTKIMPITAQSFIDNGRITP
jgi:thymidylate synthase (FAD)